MNIDGTARVDRIIGGGIIRNSAGDLIAGFSSDYGTGTNMLADQFLALHEGLLLCRSMQLTRVHIESDSAVVVHAIRQGKVENWTPYYVLKDCLHSFTGGRACSCGQISSLGA